MTFKKKILCLIGKAIEDKPVKQKKFKNVLIRIPIDILNELDSLIEKKPWVNRTQWIIQVIHEKLRAKDNER